MHVSPLVLGKYTASQLQTRATAILLTIGRDTFTRVDLARVACFNFTAAANLSAILNRELRVRDTRDVYDNVSPAQLTLPRLGAISLAVLGAAFEAKQIGGEAPLESWVRQHLLPNAKLVTFDVMKARSEADRIAERDEQRRRKAHKHARRDKAHRLRVDRFSKRRGAA